MSATRELKQLNNLLVEAKAELDTAEEQHTKLLLTANNLTLEDANKKRYDLDVKFANNLKEIDTLSKSKDGKTADERDVISLKIHVVVADNKSISIESEKYEKIIKSYNALEQINISIKQLNEKIQSLEGPAYIESLSDDQVLSQEIDKFNDEIFKYEDEKIQQCKDLLEIMDEYRALGFVSHKEYFLEYLDAIMDAETIEEMEQIQNNFLKPAIDDLSGIENPYDESAELKVAQDGKQIDLSQINKAIDAIKQGLLINDGVKWYKDGKPYSGDEINKLKFIIDLYTDKENAMRVEHEHDYHQRLSIQNKLSNELRRLEFLRNNFIEINATQDANKKKEILKLISKRQKDLNYYARFVARLKQNAIAIYNARATYLTPGYGFFETLKRFGKRDAASEDISTAKNLGEVVTALPMPSSNGFSFGTLGFDILNYSAELTKFFFDARMNKKFGVREEKPKSLFERILLGADTFLSLLLGFGGLVASGLYCMTGIGLALGGPKLFAASIVGIVDTAWGGGHFIHDTYQKLSHNNKMRDHIRKLEEHHDRRLEAVRKNTIVTVVGGSDARVNQALNQHPQPAGPSAAPTPAPNDMKAPDLLPPNGMHMAVAGTHAAGSPLIFHRIYQPTAATSNVDAPAPRHAVAPK